MHQTNDKHRSDVRRESLNAMNNVLAMSKNDLEQRILELLNRRLEYSKQMSPFYKSHLESYDIPGKLTDLAQAEQLPFTTKAHLRERYPFGFLATPINRLIRYGESTGSTGKPTSAFMTYRDWEMGNVWLERSLHHTFNSDDVVFIAIPYELAFASYDIDRGFENIGATVVAVGTLNMVCPWERTLEMMRHVHPTVLVSSPTRALCLYDAFLSKGYDPHDVGLKTLLYVGETCSRAKLRKIVRLWDINMVTAYGATETNSLSLPCEHGKQHLTEDRYYFEVVHPSTGHPATAGERGELVLTTLIAEAMPLIRYRTGDIVRVDNDPCSCGLPHRTIEHYGRLNESIAYRGRQYLRYDIEEAILSVEGTGCYYLISSGTDIFRIYVNVENRDKNKTLGEIRMNLEETLGINAQVENIDKHLIHEAMQSILKPGSVTIDDVTSIKRGISGAK